MALLIIVIAIEAIVCLWMAREYPGDEGFIFGLFILAVLITLKEYYS